MLLLCSSEISSSNHSCCKEMSSNCRTCCIEESRYSGEKEVPDPRSDDDEDVYESRPDRRHDPPEPDDDENDPLCWKFFSEQGTDAGADSNPLVWSRLLGRADELRSSRNLRECRGMGIGNHGGTPLRRKPLQPSLTLYKRRNTVCHLMYEQEHSKRSHRIELTRWSRSWNHG